MLNRRLIRIKVFQTIFGTFQEETTTSLRLQKQTRKSITGIEGTFFGLLTFITELRQFIISEHNPEDRKFKATEDDLLIYRTITDNPFADKLEALPLIKDYLNAPKINWSKEKDMMFLIYKEIKKSEEFERIKTIEDADQRAFELAVYILKYLILESVDFEHFMEEHVIVWYDEKIPILKHLEKLFENYTAQREIDLPRLSKNLDEDLEFADDLIEQYVSHSNELKETLSKYTPGWESERITKIDYVLLCMALCEFKYMSYVPVKVTMNEYIEIAKMYSTPKSSKFVNGTLDKILKDWQSTGEINKAGRGLIG